MSERPWYKRYGADFVHGSLGLTLEEKGAYSLCLDLIYDHGGPIRDDARWLAGVCGCSVRKWKSVRARLISAGKISVVDGLIMNSRARKELEKSSKTTRKEPENEPKVPRKSPENQVSPNENSGLTSENGLYARGNYQKPESRNHIETPLSPNGDAPPDEPEAEFDLVHDRPADLDRSAVGMAVKLWNAMAADSGIFPQVRKITKARRAKLLARLKDCGGLRGWGHALTRIRRSAFLTGQNDRGWRADLDFMLQEKSFTKLMEGGYDYHEPTGDGPGGGARTRGQTAVAGILGDQAGRG